jgi:hypothetical protein
MQSRRASKAATQTSIGVVLGYAITRTVLAQGYDATTSASIIMAFMVMVSAARQYILRRIFERWWLGKENEVFGMSMFCYVAWLKPAASLGCRLPRPKSSCATASAGTLRLWGKSRRPSLQTAS